MTDACQRTLEDPEANAAHLAECEECRALFDTLGLAVDEQPIAVDALPLAPWEGASHRAWPLVAGGVALIGIAVALCIALGAHPVEILQRALVPTVDTYGLIAGYAEALRQASIAWQIGFGVLFVAVNAALVLLLRRAPKGIDA
jgi:predicted anti-sigma-YlaC factor YlaD